MAGPSTSSLPSLHQPNRQPPPINHKALSEYKRYIISALKPGPVDATFTGILVNLQESLISDGTPQLATKAYRLVLRDQTGEITVHLWVAEREYQLLLSQRITIWTTHICAASTVRAFTSGKCIVTTPNSTHVFPEQNPRCRVSMEAVFGPSKCRLCPDMESFMTLEEVTKETEKKKADCTLLVKVIAVGKPVETPSVSTKVWTTRLIVSLGDTSNSNPTTPMLVQQPLVPSFLQFVGEWLVITNCRMIQDRFIVMSKISRVIVAPENGWSKSIWSHKMRIHGLSTHAILLDIFRSGLVPTLKLDQLETLTSRYPMGYHQARVKLLISRLAFTDLWLRGMLFYSHCRVCSRTRYSNKYRDSDEGFCHPEMETFGARVNPDVCGELSDETGGIVCRPVTNSTNFNQSSSDLVSHPLLITNQAFAGLVGSHPVTLADHLIHDVEEDEACTILQRLDNDLDWTRIEALLGWFSFRSPHLQTGPSPESQSLGEESSMSRLDSSEGGQLVLLDAKVLRG